MPFRLYNTLSNAIEDFRTIDPGKVRMYACGPTVYDYGHIGNFRTFVAVDILFRFLKLSGYSVHYVMNITDVDDKIIRNAGSPDIAAVRQYTDKFSNAFFEDSKALNLDPPQFVRATDHIQEMAEFISELEAKGLAYRADDGSYYFRIAKFPQYGKLSKRDFAGMEDGARVDVDEYDKDNARDFALWKAPKAGEASWQTKIGPGRPGWHIECSVMSMEELGESFDLHAGGEDLIFPHHENEIAQSEGLTGKPFAHFWFHSRFLLVEGEKMSKSLGNFYTLRDLVLKGYKPSAIRFLLTSVPYRNQLNFTFDGLQQATASVERLRNFYALVSNPPKSSNLDAASLTPLAVETKERFMQALGNDLNTAEAIGAIFEMVRVANAAINAGNWQPNIDQKPLVDVMNTFDAIFAVSKDDDAARISSIVNWAKSEGREIAPSLLAACASQLSDADIEQKIAAMEAARKSRDFKSSDAIRAELTSGGILVEITKDGVRWRRK
ncbi:MAG: cysteine--tRNA ligase [Terriglobales bacterium]|jgi:cysteinyl-tRNA synthetase